MNSLDLSRNKQIGWKKGWQQAECAFMFGCVEQKPSVSMQDCDGDANELVNTAEVVKAVQNV